MFMMPCLTMSQMDAALGLLGWTDSQLAQAANLHPKSISRIRRGASHHRRLYRRRLEMLDRIRVTLEAAGVCFLETGGVEPRQRSAHA